MAAEETVELGTNLVATASCDGVALLTTSLSHFVSRLHYGEERGRIAGAFATSKFDPYFEKVGALLGVTYKQVSKDLSLVLMFDVRR